MPFGPEKDVKVPIFENQTGRSDFEDDRLEVEQEGDVLILDPTKLGKRLPQIDFNKMLGRADPLQKIDEEQEELILEPDIDVIKKRQPMFVDMAKDRGREEAKVNLDDDEYYLPGAVDDEAAPFNPRKPRPIAYDFGKGGERFPEQNIVYDTEDQLLLDVKYPEKKVINAVIMNGGEPRFKDRLPEDPFYQDQPLNELKNDITAALKAIKPNVPQANFGKGGAKDNRDLKEVMREQDQKD